jgi:hypothetical protein
VSDEGGVRHILRDSVGLISVVVEGLMCLLGSMCSDIRRALRRGTEVHILFAGSGDLDDHVCHTHLNVELDHLWYQC